MWLESPVDLFVPASDCKRAKPSGSTKAIKGSKGNRNNTYQGLNLNTSRLAFVRPKPLIQ